MDDWQSAAFNNRHLHNRVHQRGQSKGGKGSAAFDARNTLGSYEVKCAAARTEDTGAITGIDLEICQFSEDGAGLVGTIQFPGLLQAFVVLAGSRKEMAVTIDAMKARSNKPKGPIRWSQKENLKRKEQDEQKDGGIGNAEQEAGDDEDEDEEEEDDDEDEDDEESEEEEHNRFEKNSFREPKFWMQWQGQRRAKSGETAGITINGSGYVVFNGNDCKKFSGTLTCDTFDWSNIKMTGWKSAWKAERDIAISWT